MKKPIRFALGMGSSCFMATAMAGGMAFAAACCFFPPTAGVIDIESGAAAFQQHCAGCHSLGASNSRGLGPPLGDAGAWAETRVAGMTGEEYVYQSIVKPGAFRAPGANAEMPANVADGLTDETVLSLAAYVLSRSGNIRYNLLARHFGEPRDSIAGTVAAVDLASIERGRELFFGQMRCALCHPLDGNPGDSLVAPSLLKAGSHSRAYLEESIRKPSHRITTGYETWQLVKDGVPYSGRRLAAPEGRVRLLTVDGSGSLRLDDFALGEVDDEVLIRSDVSTMPARVEPVAADEMGWLVDYLSTLR